MLYFGGDIVCLLCLHIIDAFKSHDKYFTRERNTFVRLGLSLIWKVTIVFQMLVYDLLANATNKYTNIGELTAIESMKRFW